MPTINRPCRNRGCPNSLPCVDHPIADSWSRDRKKTTSPFYGSIQWQKLRKAYKASHPLCERCEREGKVRPATMVHHKLSVKDHPELKLDPNNFESLCRDCHERAEGRKS